MSTHFKRSIPTIKVLVIDRVTEKMNNFLMFYQTTNGYQCLLAIIGHKIALFIKMKLKIQMTLIHCVLHECERSTEKVGYSEKRF